MVKHVSLQAILESSTKHTEEQFSYLSIQDLSTHLRWRSEHRILVELEVSINLHFGLKYFSDLLQG